MNTSSIFMEIIVNSFNNETMISILNLPSS